MGTKAQARYYAIKNALTKNEKAFISYYEMQYVLRRHIPSPEDAATYLKLPATEVNNYLNRKPVIKALDNRGIPWRQHTREGLTDKQVACAITVMNFADERSTEDKLDSLGVNPTQYYAWLNDPQFKNLVDNLADQNLKNIRPAAVAEFTKMVQKGDWRAVKHYLDVTGELQTSEAPNSQLMLTAILEILQEEVKDSETLMRIAEKLKLVTANRTLEVVSQSVPRSIEAHSIPIDALSSDVTEEEVEHFKKTIGFG